MVEGLWVYMRRAVASVADVADNNTFLYLQSIVLFVSFPLPVVSFSRYHRALFSTMYSISLAAVVWSVAVAAAAAAAAASETTFSLSAVPNNSTRINLVTTYARLYHKYNMSLPATLSSVLQHQHRALAARGDAGSAIAYPSSANDGEYLIDVDVGTPPKRFRLNLDTGSSDVWVYGSAIPKSFLKGQAQYEPSQSSTSRLVPFAVWLAGYIDFSFVGGAVYKDTVSVVAAEGDGGGLTVQTQGLQVAALVARSIVQDAGMDGILGLGFDKLNFAFPTKQKTWFSNIKERLSAPLFTVDFQHRKRESFCVYRDVGHVWT